MILSKVIVVVWRQVEGENRSLPVAVRVSKTHVLKLLRKLKHATFSVEPRTTTGSDVASFLTYFDTIFIFIC